MLEVKEYNWKGKEPDVVEEEIRTVCRCGRTIGVVVKIYNDVREEPEVVMSVKERVFKLLQETGAKMTGGEIAKALSIPSNAIWSSASELHRLKKIQRGVTDRASRPQYEYWCEEGERAIE